MEALGRSHRGRDARFHLHNNWRKLQHRGQFLLISSVQVLILDEHHIKKRETYIKLLQKALMINLADACKQCNEQGIYSILFSHLMLLL